MCVNYKTKINYYQTGHLEGNKTGLDIPTPTLKFSYGCQKKLDNPYQKLYEPINKYACITTCDISHLQTTHFNTISITKPHTFGRPFKTKNDFVGKSICKLV